MRLHKVIWVHCIFPKLGMLTLCRLRLACRWFNDLIKNNNDAAENIEFWKTFTLTKPLDWCLHQAARSRNKELVEFFSAKGACNWNYGLEGASRGGHKDLVDFFIAKGAYDWDWALAAASRGGHKELVELFIEKGAKDLNFALGMASWKGHKELIEYFQRFGIK